MSIHPPAGAYGARGAGTDTWAGDRDADQDGRLDYIEARQFAAAEFHHNTSRAAQGNAFIGLSPRILVGDVVGGSPVRTINDAAQTTDGGPRSRPAVGARVAIRLKS